MTAVLDFFKSLCGGHSFLDERNRLDFFARSALSSLLLIFSAGFLFLGASRINGECVFALAENARAAEEFQIIEETRKIALDRVLYEDFVKSRAANLSGELFMPFAAPQNFAAEESGGKIPLYAPTVVIKALVVLDGGSACVLDIDGEEAGKVFKAGDLFGGGQGRVVKINESGVTWRWLEREYTTWL